MPFRTTAFEAAGAMGWDMAELSRRSGVPLTTLYEIRRGRRAVGSRTMPALRQAFPHLSFEQLFVFVPTGSAAVDKKFTIADTRRAGRRTGR